MNGLKGGKKITGYLNVYSDLAAARGELYVKGPTSMIARQLN